MSRRSNKKRKFQFKKITLKVAPATPDWVLLGLVLVLTVFGVIMVGNASVVEALQDFGDQYHFLRLQIQWVGFGILAMVLASFFRYQRLKPLAFPLMVVNLFLLLLVLIPGIGTEVMGARRWLGVSQFGFQPAELVKLVFVLYLASFFARKRPVWPFLAMMAAILGLIILEPDLSTTVIVTLTGMVVYFASGAPLWLIGILTGVGGVGGVGLILSSTYRRERLLTFLNPTRDPLGASYHIRQILIALGSGGLFGLGLGQSRQKHEYLPATTTDSIFAVIGEELGFIGAALVVIAFMVLIWRGIKIARESPDDFGRLLAIGITSWIGLQAFINLAAMVALVPLTGVPLPFISYGGSSLVIALTGIGILLNISKQKVVKR
jgi:cell division protein FtsW